MKTHKSAKLSAKSRVGVLKVACGNNLWGDHTLAILVKTVGRKCWTSYMLVKTAKLD